jgi:hypothetical protein
MTPTEYTARLAALTSAHPIDYRALALFHFDHQLDGLVNRPRMYAADDIRVLEALAWQALCIRDAIRCPRMTERHNVHAMINSAARRHGIYCGSTSPAYAKPTLTIEEMALIIHDAWKLCDETWTAEEDNAMGA